MASVDGQSGELSYAGQFSHYAHSSGGFPSTKSFSFLFLSYPSIYVSIMFHICFISQEETKETFCLVFRDQGEKRHKRDKRIPRAAFGTLKWEDSSPNVTRRVP